MTYLPFLVFGLLGVFIVFTGQESDTKVIVGSAFYFVAIFGAAILSMRAS